jgi:hypothetical protein
MAVLFICDNKCGAKVDGNLKSNGVYQIPVKWLVISVDGNQFITCSKACFDALWNRQAGKPKLTILTEEE